MEKGTFAKRGKKRGAEKVPLADELKKEVLNFHETKPDPRNHQ